MQTVTSCEPTGDVMVTSSKRRRQRSPSCSKRRHSNVVSKGRTPSTPSTGDVGVPAEPEMVTSPIVLGSTSAAAIAERRVAESGGDADIASLLSPTGLVLDVVCGLNRAKLFVDGLRNGSKTPCIFVEATSDGEQRPEAWLTPNQFQQSSGRGTARDWKRSIKHHGTSLKALLSSKTLVVDPPSCRCPVCSGAISVRSHNQYERDAASSDLPLNLSTTSSDHRNSPIEHAVMADLDFDPVEQSDTDDEETLLRKRLLIAALSLVNIRDASSYPSTETTTDDDVVDTSSPCKSMAADWDWNQLEYTKRAKQEDSENSAESLNCQPGHSTSVSNDVTPVPASTSVFDFVVMTSFTDAYLKFRSQREQQFDKKDKEKNCPKACEGEVDAIKVERVVNKSLSENGLCKSTDGGATDLSNEEDLNCSFNSTSSLTNVTRELRDRNERAVGYTSESETTSSAIHRRTNHVIVSSVPSPTGPVEAPSSIARPASSKDLPDLVRSVMPGNTSSIDIGTALVVVNLESPERLATNRPEILFPVDACGAVDMTAATARQLALVLMTQKQCLVTPLLADKRRWSEDEVLDLSCKPSSHAVATARVASTPTAKMTQKTAEARRRNREQRRRRTNEKKASATQLVHNSSTVTSSAPSPVDVDSPLRWGVRDVIEFVSEVPGCQIYAETFKRFGVRGASLPVLSLDHMTAILRMDLDAAKSLRLAIDRMMTSCSGSGPATQRQAELVL